VTTAIELDAEVRSVLERRAGSLTLPYRVVVRAKLVLLAADGDTNREIAAPRGHIRRSRRRLAKTVRGRGHRGP
jgi:hypothetical protein